MQKASVISATGDAIAIFREAQCLTPRGRYDIKVFQTFVQLHGKTFDYKIPISTVLRLFLLPHKDGRQIFFVVSLDPPIKQGQTRYHFLVLLFNKDEEVTFELPMSEEEVKEKFEGRLSRENSGPTYEVLGKIMKGLANRKVTVPGNFVGFSGTPAIGCSYKAAAGYLYPLERGFIYVHKPPIHIRFEEITSVNFARSGGSTRSFDFEVETKNGVVHTFSSIEKEEYGRLYDFISNKKLRVKNSGRSDKPSHMDDFGDSDVEDAPDAYLARVKAEGIEREAQGDDSESNSDEETDEDFKPGEEGSDVAEEFDSNVSSSDEDDSDQSGGSDKKAKKEKKKKKKEKEKKPRKSKADDDKPKKARKPKKEKDDNKPKRPQSAYFLWLNSNRDKIKAENPGISITELTKKAGELWKKLEDKSQWEAKAAKEKEAYEKAMKEYKASGGASNDKEKDKGSAKSSSKTKSPAKSDAFASKEFISTSEDSSDDEDKKKSQKKPAVKKESKTADKSAKKKNKKESEDEDEEEEDMDVSSASSASSDSD
nr:EOG090X02Z1 [Eulimnadia texana]